MQQYKMYKLFEEEQALALRAQLLPLEWKEGKARTAELTGTIKQNLEVTPQENDVGKALSMVITKQLLGDFAVARDVFPMQATAVKFNKYLDTGTYNRHTDAPWMGPVRTDFAVTVFLTNPEDYDGGELHIEDSIMGETVVKGRAGEAFIYECGLPHWVTPVTRGERISAIGWIQSMFPDAKQRELLRHLRRVTAEMEAQMDLTKEKDQIREWFVDIGKVHSALFRIWAQK